LKPSDILLGNPKIAAFYVEWLSGNMEAKFIQRQAYPMSWLVTTCTKGLLTYEQFQSDAYDQQLTQVVS
jgi:hypothetical protein